jgi:hypothetical protein
VGEPIALTATTIIAHSNNRSERALSTWRIGSGLVSSNPISKKCGSGLNGIARDYSIIGLAANN